MSTPYELLGISKNATQSEIKKAYHKLARKLHPDVNPDKASTEKFKNITAAYELLSDTSKKQRYDNGEIDINGNPTPFGGGAYDRGGFRGNTHQQNINPEDLASMFGGRGGGFGGGGGFNFADLFGMGGGGFSGASQAPQPSNYSLAIPFNLSITGGETEVVLENNKKLKIKIPAGVQDQATLRLKGQGAPSYTGQKGDALIKISIQKSLIYKREDNNILYTLPISLKQAVLGDKATVPTPSGDVIIKIPPYSSSGHTLRLKGKGVKNKGDFLVKLSIKLPKNPNKALTQFINTWEETDAD